MAELLLPLRPVLISPVEPKQAGDAKLDCPPAWEASLDGGPSVADTAAVLNSDTSASLTFVPDADSSMPSIGDMLRNPFEAELGDPVSKLFFMALQRAPRAAIANVRRMFEELYHRPSLCTTRVKQLYVAILEQQGTIHSLVQGVAVFAESPGGELSVGDTSLQDLIKAIRFVVKHSIDDNHEKFSCHEACGPLWSELIRYSSGPRKVLVQYYQSQVTSQKGLSQPQGSVVNLDVVSNCFSNMEYGPAEADLTTVLLKDAAPTITSLLRSSQGQANALNLQRYINCRGPDPHMCDHASIHFSHISCFHPD